MESHFTLPQWLDDYIFNELGAQYCRSNADMAVIDWDKRDMLNYLGTYFPRSYAESRCIFGNFFGKNHPELLDKEEIQVFDFGCGTGGEIVGLVEQLSIYSSAIKNVEIRAFDGNQDALRLCETVLDKMRERIEFELIIRPCPFVISDFYNLSILDNVINKKFDIVMSFKAICEFISKERFEKTNAYEHISRTFLPKLDDFGILLLEDITTRSEVTKEWLPQIMDEALNRLHCNIVDQNDGYSHAIFVNHRKKINDVSKVAWRIITNHNPQQLCQKKTGWSKNLA